MAAPSSPVGSSSRNSNGGGSRSSKRELKIRFGTVTEANVEQLKKLNLAIFPVVYNPKFYKDVFKPDHAEFTKLVYHTDVLVGAICCRFEQAEQGLLKLYIMTLGVLAPYRGYGIGTKMVQYILDRVALHANIHSVFLHVQTSNDDALRFYTQRFGFSNVGTIKNYYKRIVPPDCFIVERVFHPFPIVTAPGTATATGTVAAPVAASTPATGEKQ